MKKIIASILLAFIAFILLAVTQPYAPTHDILILNANGGITASLRSNGQDDQVKIQQAIDLCAEAGGGSVQLDGDYLLDNQPDATYMVLAIKTNVWLRGGNLKLKDGAVEAGETGHPIIDTHDERDGTFAVNWRISDLTIDGNRANQNPDTATSMNIGIWVRQQANQPDNIASYIDNVLIRNTISAGFYFEEVEDYGLIPQNVYARNCVAINCGGEPDLTWFIGGFHFDTVSGVNLRDCLALNNTIGAMLTDSSYNNLLNFRTQNNVYGVYLNETASRSRFNRIDMYSYNDVSYSLFVYCADDNWFTGIAEMDSDVQPVIWGRYIERDRFGMKVRNRGNGGTVYIRDHIDCIFDFDEISGE